MMFAFLADTYETERLKTLSVWSAFHDGDMEYRPAPRIRSPREHMVHQCISEESWMKNMLAIDSEMPPLPEQETRIEFLRYYAAVSSKRLALLREKPEAWFNEELAFFDVSRTRSWILMRRFTHSAHHRAQLTVYLRLLGRPVYSTYGPTADTGGLPANQAPTIYRYKTSDDLLQSEAKGGTNPELAGPGEKSPTERPSALPLRRALERVDVRTRDSEITRSAWRALVDSSEGSGSVTLLDSGFYRGDGIFLGLTQEQLIAEYARLNPHSDEPAVDFLQLG